MSLKSDGESYWGTRMRAKWDSLVEFITISPPDDLILGNGVVGSHAIYLSSGATFVESLIIIMPNLPTSDPNVGGQLWNNNGVLSVSAG